MSLTAKKIGSDTLTLGQNKTYQLDRSKPIRSINIRLAGSVTVSGGTASGSVADVAPARILTNISLRRNGQDVVFNLPGYMIYLKNQIEYGTAGSLTTLASGATQTNTPFSVALKIPFENLGGVKPFDTLLGVKGLSSLELIIDVASNLNVMCTNGNDRTFAVGTTPITIDVDQDDEDGAENFAFGDLKASVVQSATPSGALNNLLVKPFPNNTRYKYILAISEASTTLSSNGIVDNFIFRQGDKVLFNKKASRIQDDMKSIYKLESVPTGCYLIPLMSDGRLNQTAEINGFSDFECELVTLAAGTVRFVGVQYTPPQVVVQSK